MNSAKIITAAVAVVSAAPSIYLGVRSVQGRAANKWVGAFVLATAVVGLGSGLWALYQVRPLPNAAAAT